MQGLIDLGKTIVEKATPRGVVILTLWIATLVAVVILLTACGAINYQPISKSTLTIENELTGETDNGKTQEAIE